MASTKEQRKANRQIAKAAADKAAAEAAVVAEAEKAAAEAAAAEAAKTAEAEKAAADAKPAKPPVKAKTPLEEANLRWVAAHARPAESDCLCGCGNRTKGRFFPGHDAVLKAQLAVTAKGDDAELAELARTTLATFGWLAV